VHSVVVVDKTLRVADVQSAVLIVSCKAYSHRMTACQDTWARFLSEEFRIPTIFVVGNSTISSPYIFNPRFNFLTVRSEDTYDALSLKVKLAYQWILAETDISHLFKCDDDTFINPLLFSSLDMQGSYIGTPLTFNQDESLVYASGGRILPRPSGNGYCR
jgi:hypothetical protein